MEKCTFNITVTMPKRWVSYFCSFLKRMQTDGKIGHSELIGFYADGDGDFRPTFEFEGVEFEVAEPQYSEQNYIYFYDAG